jgi:hypothetical protein
MRPWLRDFGFPALVVANLVGSASLAASARVPDSVPDYALQADAVYRLEVGAACFVVIYLATVAFFLALDGRGFTEFGNKGIRAAEVVRAVANEEQVATAMQLMFIHDMEKHLEDIEAAIRSLTEEESG